MRQQKLEASAQEAFKDIYPEIFEKRKKTFGGFHYDFDPRDTLSVSAEERERLYEELWARGGFHFWLETFHDLYANKEANKTAYDFWQKKVAARIKDPKKREILCPEEWPHTFGTVRPSLEQNYYEVMNQDNVEIISIKRGGDEGIKEITETGVRLNSGREIELDQIILATGFDTHTGGFKQIDIRGKQGLPLTDKWSQGCNSLNGLNTAVSLGILSAPMSQMILTHFFACLCFPFFFSAEIPQPVLPVRTSWSYGILEWSFHRRGAGRVGVRVHQVHARQQDRVI